MIRFFNGLVITGQLPLEAKSGLEVWTDGSQISYVGPKKDEMPRFEREIDLRGDILMPGLKNAHTHTAMTFVRSYADDLPLQDWLFGKILPLEGKLTGEDIYEFTRLGIMEYLTSGTTACFDMYYQRQNIVDAVLDTGFRASLCGASAAYDVIADDCRRFNSVGDRVRYLPGIHSEYMTSEQEFIDVKRLIDETHLPCYAHNSETKKETEEAKERRNGMTPTEYMDSLGLFEYGGGGFHCVYLSDNDIEIFKKRGLYAVTCPASNAKLASGVAPLTKFMERGVKLAIGTDGAASNNALDMFREMYLACVLQKLRDGSAAACPAENILSAAITGSARAMGYPECDSIAEGKQADMIIIDLSRPSMQPVISPVKNIVYSGSKDVVRMTMVAGRILYENGEFFIGEDAGSIYEKCARRFERLVRE